MKPQCNTSADCLREMIPTIEEVKRVAIDNGAKINYRQFNFSQEKYLHGFETLEQLQAFAQHYIEVGRKEQREKDANLCEEVRDYSIGRVIAERFAEAIRNNTGE